jgi:diguanylate cyclase (GGDEF)-like protein
MTTQNEKPDIQAALALLKQTFAKKIPAKVEDIRQSWENLKSAPNDEAVLPLFHRQVHTLAGTAATYGFAAIADYAKKIELSLPETEQITCLPVSEIEWLLEKLATAVGSEAAVKIPAMRPIPIQNMPLPAGNSRNKLIYLVDEDVDFLSTMSMQIQSFGYFVVTFSDLVLFDEAVERQVPDIVIMDVIFGGGHKAGIRHIARMNAARIQSLNTIFINGSHDITMRLDAVRANGLAYFSKGVLVGSLVDAIEKFTLQIVEEPYRILIVDDAPEQSGFAALILQQAGMKTIEVNAPLQLLDVLASFQPDLILMDIYMPDCNGLELSKVVRQMDSYVNIPIVFLSSELDLKKKLGAMSLGGDDFLTKPVLPWHLTSAVTSRVQRGRMISKLADTDGAKREKISISIAMLDIDHFKKVNDTYGHPAGDRVLKSLANLFKQNLRQYDVIGRYGGEEFLVVLSNVNSSIAKTIMDKLRIRFSEISQLSDDGDFSCSFSCGIASFPDFGNGTALIQEADKALYKAKNGGRNQVVISSQ